MARQFHRPAHLDPEAAESIEGSADTAVSSELAHRAAQALIGGFPGTDAAAPGADASPADDASNAARADDHDDPITRQGVVAAVAAHGVDTVAELWADSPATTLPGTLWRLFLVREWIRRDGDLVDSRYATVVDLAGADDDALARLEEALTQARPVPAMAEVGARLDAVLAGGVEGVGGLVPVLAMTSGFLRALAAGTGPEWIDDDTDELAHRVTRRESALLATADELDEAGRRAGAGRLD